MRRILTAGTRFPSRTLTHVFSLTLLLTLFAAPVDARKRRAVNAPSGRIAVVIDERLSALRDAPDFAANVSQRLGRGRTVALLGARRAPGGVTFARVAVTSRTSGWVQADALASPARAGDDERLLRLARGSAGFDRLERVAILLDMFPRSALRPAALLVLGDAAAEAAPRLSREAARRLDEREMTAGGAPTHTYFLNYNGLDRYRRLGVNFAFVASLKQFAYDGAAWREILRRHPRSPEATEARRRLGPANTDAAR